jgi:hypothetical protein
MEVLKSKNGIGIRERVTTSFSVHVREKVLANLLEML